MANWQSTGTTLELNTNQLPGGAGALRVVASDGFLSGQDTSEGLQVPLHAPSAQIVLPDPGQVFYPTQQVVLHGTAYDLEDGSLGDEAFEWSSNIDGFLGTGANLSTSELTTGDHVITLTVTDSDEMSTQVQRSMEVTEEDAPEALNLEVSPFGVGVVAELGSAAGDYALSVRSSSETELDWTASEDVSWLALDTTAGTTPSELMLKVDPAGLRVGVHSGKIRFESSEAGNSLLEVTVTLEVTGKVVYLPLVLRLR